MFARKALGNIKHAAGCVTARTPTSIDFRLLPELNMARAVSGSQYRYKIHGRLQCF